MKHNVWVILITVALGVVVACNSPVETPAVTNGEPTSEIVVSPPIAATAHVTATSAITLSLFITLPDNQLTYDQLAQFEAETGYAVEIFPAPGSVTEGLSQQLQFLEGGFPDIDVYQIDVIWPGILAQHAVDLYEYIPPQEVDAHFTSIVQNNTVDGKLVGLPWFVGAGLLYYRTDLLEKYGYDGPPATWDELEAMAATIQAGERDAGHENFWGFVWQGDTYEGLTCDALEWQVTEGGGHIIEPDGTITINNEAAAAAFTRAARWVGTISPPAVLTYQEEDARGMFQSGHAAFMRNWPYAYAMGNSEASSINGLFDITTLPAGAAGRSAATLGGGQLMVSAYSEHPGPAAELVRFMAGYEAQKDRAILISTLPTIADLYNDADVIEAQPIIPLLLDVFNNAVARPSTVTGGLYNDVSVAYFTAVHSILRGEAIAEDALNNLELELQTITGFETGPVPQ